MPITNLGYSAPGVGFISRLTTPDQPTPAEQNYLIRNIAPATITDSTTNSAVFTVQFNRKHSLTGPNRVEVTDFLADSETIMASINSVRGVLDINGTDLPEDATEADFYRVEVRFPTASEGNIILRLRAE